MAWKEMKIDRVDDACWGGYAQERIEANEAVKAAVRIFKERGVRNIIDIGCGGGRDSLFLAKQGFVVVGLDYSPKALEVLESRIKEEKLGNVRTALGDIRDVKIPDATFDAAVADMVFDLFKIDDAKKAIAEMTRILKPGAPVVVVISSTNSSIYRNRNFSLTKDGIIYIGMGKEIEKGTLSFRGHVKETGEDRDAIFHFFSEKELREVFKDFKLISLTSISEKNNQFWALTATKKYGNLS